MKENIDYIITNAEAIHVEGIHVIENMSFSIPWTIHQIETQLPNEQHEMYVAVDKDNRVLGYIGYMYVVDEGYISNVAVLPEVRKNGIAQKLIEKSIKSAIDKNLAFLTLEVRESNSNAISLYSKCGFNEVGKRKNYYKKPNEDAILMTLYFESRE